MLITMTYYFLITINNNYFLKKVALLRTKTWKENHAIIIQWGLYYSWLFILFCCQSCSLLWGGAITGLAFLLDPNWNSVEILLLPLMAPETELLRMFLVILFPNCLVWTGIYLLIKLNTCFSRICFLAWPSLGQHHTVLPTPKNNTSPSAYRKV